MKNLVIKSSLVLRNLCVAIAVIIIFLTLFVGILMTNSEIKYMGLLAIKFSFAALIFASINYFFSTMLEKIKYKYSCN